jgi:Iron-Sulfur binding protein C terminal
LSAMLRSMWSVISSIPDDVELVWQTDGRPMSGDIGRGTAKASVSLAGLVKRVLVKEGIPGHVQPAGGTNDATAPLLAEAGLLWTANGVAGIAVGGYARKVCTIGVLSVPSSQSCGCRSMTESECGTVTLSLARPDLCFPRLSICL